MREIVPFHDVKAEMNLRETLESGEDIDSLNKFFVSNYGAYLCDLVEDGESIGAIIYVPSITAKELLDEFKEHKRDDFYADDEDDD